MRLRGGGIGHKATWEWNDLLLSNAGKAVDDGVEGGDEEMDEEEAGGKEGGEEVGEEPEAAQEDDWHEEDDWYGDDLDLGGELGGDEDKHPEVWALIVPDAENEENEGSESDESDGSEEEVPDRVIPDDGEELNNDIYANEGYGTL